MTQPHVMNLPLYKAEFLLTKYEDGREIDYVQSVPDSLQAENSR